MTYSHHSMSIIDPYYGDIDLNKRELLYLLGGEDNMLNACSPAIEWIAEQTLDDKGNDVNGQWLWDNLPQCEWYCWLLSEIWDVEQEFLAEADPDWYDLAANTLQEFAEAAYRESMKTKDAIFINNCRTANAARFRRLVDPHYRKFQDDIAFHDPGTTGWHTARDAYLKQVSGYNTRYNRVKDKLDQRINASLEIKSIRAKHAQAVRDSGLLPDWKQVCKVLRHFYERESIHATEFEE